MKRPGFTHIALLAAIACLAGCNPPQGESTPTSSAAASQGPTVEVPQPSAAPSLEASTTASPAAPEVIVLDDSSIQSVAQAFITARENRMSWLQPDPASWLTNAAQYMTPEGHRRLVEQYPVDEGGSLGGAWDLAKEHGLAVSVSLGECMVMDAAGVNTADAKVVTCRVLDLPLDKNSKPLPLSSVPDGWPFNGPQQNAILQMHRVDGAWKVDWDMTGMAS